MGGDPAKEVGGRLGLGGIWAMPGRGSGRIALRATRLGGDGRGRVSEPPGSCYSGFSSAASRSPVRGSTGDVPVARRERHSMARDTEQLTKLILTLGKLSEPLVQDTSRAAQELKKRNRKGIRSSRDRQELVFWGKVTVSCLFAHISAVGSVTRKCVQLFRGFGDLTLSNREIAKLTDRRYDPDTDRVLGPTTPLSAIESLKLGLKYFAQLVGADFKLATGDDRWQGLRELQFARRRFTHPERIEDLYALEMFGSLQSSLVWFYGEMSRFLHAAFAAVGQTGFEMSSNVDLHIRPQATERFKLFF